MDVSETGANARSAAIFLERRVEAPRELEEAPEGLVRDESVGIHLGRVGPERDRVVPDIRLPQRERPEAHQDQGRDGDPGTPAPGPSPGGELRDGPRQHDENADERDVGVPVRHALSAHLDESDHGQERDCVPEPSHRDVRSAARPEDRQRRHGRQQRGGARHGPARRRRPLEGGMRVPGRQVHRPDELAQEHSPDAHGR